MSDLRQTLLSAVLGEQLCGADCGVMKGKKIIALLVGSILQDIRRRMWRFYGDGMPASVIPDAMQHGMMPRCSGT